MTNASTLDEMRIYYNENKQDYLAPILHDAIEELETLLETLLTIRVVADEAIHKAKEK